MTQPSNNAYGSPAKTEAEPTNGPSEDQRCYLGRFCDLVDIALAHGRKLIFDPQKERGSINSWRVRVYIGKKEVIEPVGSGDFIQAHDKAQMFVHKINKAYGKQVAEVRP